MGGLANLSQDLFLIQMRKRLQRHRRRHQPVDLVDLLDIDIVVRLRTRRIGLSFGLPHSVCAGLEKGSGGDVMKLSAKNNKKVKKTQDATKLQNSRPSPYLK
jgi:hypothetical protein